MNDTSYDAIVVGARCAGSPLGMLLARRGYRVLVVDRATFPSDTVSTHLIHPPGVLALQRWGLLERLVATGCPPVDTYVTDFGPFALVGSPAIEDSRVGYAPRRTVLDALLVEAARESGADVREGFTVEDVVFTDGRVTGIRGHGRDGRTVTESARVVIGADGRHSLVARTVRPESYRERAPLLAAYYSYFSGLPMHGRFETYDAPSRGIAVWPTNDDLTLVIAGWPYAEFGANKSDVEGNFLATIALVPSLAERVAEATREERFAGTAVPNYFRKPYGDGWALVGDAGYNRDFITAQGIQDAFRDAELCANALHGVFSGGHSYDQVMGEYQSTRDAQVSGIYEFTCELASLEPPPEELAQLLAAAHGNQEAMDQFARVTAGAEPPEAFFAPENVQRIMAAASTAPPTHLTA
jgi:2-polyprenyl-6-methoxyphenol hydroxylase-like FAD-dependent oxidoreductase